MQLHAKIVVLLQNCYVEQNCNKKQSVLILHWKKEKKNRIIEKT